MKALGALLIARGHYSCNFLSLILVITCSDGQKKQVKSSSDNRCVLVHTCTSIYNINCSFTCTVVLVPLKCSTNCLDLTFHTLIFILLKNGVFLSRFQLECDRATDGRTDGHTLLWRNSRTHLKRLH